MEDYHQTAVQAVKSQRKDLLSAKNYRLDYRLNSVNALGDLLYDYDLFLLDRDGTLQSYHSKKRVPEFEETLQLISPKSEIISNSHYDEFCKIGDIFKDLMPVNKLVNFAQDSETPYLLRFVNGDLKIMRYNLKDKTLSDMTSKLKWDNGTIPQISYNYKKPNPLVVNSVLDMNIQEGRIPSNGARVLMVGDRYLIDIVAGNLAKVDTAKVKPYKPFSDEYDLIAMRYLVDSPIGFVMSRI